MDVKFEYDNTTAVMSLYTATNTDRCFQPVHHSNIMSLSGMVHIV
ncbi:hypothetical protein KG087_04845 [Lacticaseibacillus zeae]|uniref:Uncharacterized protein n=1 Tax=Lacticaseibacillus zeae TaxID=57037 RepID=A0A5R8M1F1_LACZE|nr:hypothetical protein KG087_04845 [Lacticaseibacillus zeae]TLF43457.1 hypothetical protein FEI14_00805 [Lacticaseibacillus zeae]